MSENIQKLSYELIEEATQKYNEINEEIINLEINGKQVPFKVEIYKHFSPTAVKNFSTELIERLELVKEVDKHGFGDIIMPYIMFLTIKHFTTLNLPNNFYEQVLAIENMLNSGALFQIYLHFDDNEIEGIKEELDYVIGNFNVNFDILKDYQDSVKDKINDKSLLVK